MSEKFAGMKECAPGLFEVIVAAADAGAALEWMDEIAGHGGGSNIASGGIPIGTSGEVLVWTQWKEWAAA